MRGILVWGAGGHGKVVLDVALAAANDTTIGFYDDDERRSGERFCGFPLFTGRDTWPRAAALGFGRFVIAIGDNRRRAESFALAAQFAEPATLVHPSAVVAASASVGAGTVVMPRAVINAGARIGPNSIVNTAAIVEHDCVAGAHVHLAPGSVLGGQAVVEELAQVGLGALVLPRVRIGRGALLGAGAVAVRDVPAETVATGVPARRMERRAS